MTTPPVKPATTPPMKPAQANPTQGSVDPKEHPPTATPSGAVIIQNAPPLPAGRPSGREGEQKPVMESAEAEQNAGKAAMDMWKKRQEAEEEAGKAALKRHTSTK